MLASRDLQLWYGDFHALKGVSMTIEPHSITAIIGPSGCGKSTMLRCFNRMNDLVEGCRVEGEVLFEGRNIYGRYDLTELRKRVGMVFQRPNPFPLSVFENVAYGARIHGLAGGERLRESVKKALIATQLWTDVADRLSTPALDLSAEQQQRLCISRLLAVAPDVLLMDEPCSALDPLATQHIEELMLELKKDYTIVIVTHNMQQAARVSDFTGFMLLGELVEFGETDTLFTAPRDRRTEDYITGRYG
ncbi:MAG: phosphate ABC transporter ATP-binding protein [Candidatus Brocadiae bacterium]|nr:phosphate ABC transporter ATP-binding protein [Candidatus Brocadiia bacterium]